MKISRHTLAHSLIALALAVGGASPAAAHTGHGASEASTLSALPIAVSVAAPARFLSAGAVFTVVAVEASAEGAVWVLARASDGARASVTLSAKAAGGLSVAAGMVVTVAAFSAGWVLSAAGQAIAFIPNALGAALLHNERVTP
jgi:hypothetical protein